MAQEIERKFLVVGEYKDLAHNSMHLVQGYIASGRRTVRVRIGEGGAWLTIKGPSRNGGLSRFEWEKEIAVLDAQQLMELCLPGVIHKTRWLIPASTTNNQSPITNNQSPHLTWEVDEFHGRLEGLVLAELELPREDYPYEKLPFVGEEVTGNPRYYNANM